MSDGAFLQRWSRLKRAAVEAPAADNAKEPSPLVAAENTTATDQAEPPAPTMADVALLGPDADYAPYMAQAIDRGVQRSALKKLFAEPSFNVMDRLDIYIDDYNQASPVSAAMLSSLQHASDLLTRGIELEARLAAATALPPSDETSA